MYFSFQNLISAWNIGLKYPVIKEVSWSCYYYIYWYYIFCLPWQSTLVRKKNYWPFFLRNPFIQLSFKTMVFTIHKGNSVSLPSRHNIKHVLASHLFLSNWWWHIVWLMTRTVGWGTCRATVETDKREIRFADSINHGKHVTQNIWWPYFIIFPNQQKTSISVTHFITDENRN